MGDRLGIVVICCKSSSIATGSSEYFLTETREPEDEWCDHDFLIEASYRVFRDSFHFEIFSIYNANE